MKRSPAYRRTLLNWVKQIFDPIQFLRGVRSYIWYFRDWHGYSKMQGAEPIRLLNSQPSLHDRTETTPFDKHYFFQDIWAFRRITTSGCSAHVDVGSRVDFVGLLSCILPVTFIDIRPLAVDLENFVSRKGSILDVPYESESIESLSCLHVAEHIGLGRYGDDLDPMGTIKAAHELERVLKSGGNLFFSLPIGKPRVCFNSHRIHAPSQVLKMFPELQLVEMSGIDDEGQFLEDIAPNVLSESEYACGLFWFTKS